MITLGKQEDGSSADSKRISGLKGGVFEMLGANGCYILGTIITLISTIMFSGVSLLTRELKQVHYSVMLFNYGLLLIISSATIMTLSLVTQWITLEKGHAVTYPF